MPLSLLTVRSAFAVLSVAAAVSVAAVALVGKPEPVQAFPAYSNKEGVKCGYCHVRAAGGGPRNYRGKYYKQNNLSFSGFDDAAQAQAAGEPIGPDADAKPTSMTVPATGGASGTTPVASPSPVAPPDATGVAIPAAISKLRDKAAATAAALKKSPKSAAAKKAHSAALTALARGIMNDGTIPATKKYPEALSLSRQAVALDPTNKNAAADVKRITDVYKQMGRPVPK